MNHQAVGATRRVYCQNVGQAFGGRFRSTALSLIRRFDVI